MPMSTFMNERAAEAGFTLIEVLVCVALLVMGSVLALAVFPSIARASQTDLVRDAATGIARNAIERTRAVAAYYPAAGVLDATARATTTADHAWAIGTTFRANVAARFHRSFCAAHGATTDVAMTLTTTYDRSSDTLVASVQYPPDPCDLTRQAQVTLTTQLAPAGYAPRTELRTPIADPDRQ